MADALHVVHHGVDATRMVLPTTFKWAVFAVALALMAAPVAHLTCRVILEQPKPEGVVPSESRGLDARSVPSGTSDPMAWAPPAMPARADPEKQCAPTS